MRRKTVLLLALFIFSVYLLVLPANGQGQTSALPPEAQKNFERGLAAVQQQEWGLAVRYFTEAEKAAPTSPAILFNLGLAHAKAGHELAAVLWLHAYLAAAPQADNAAAVRKEITRLEVATEAKIAKIFKAALEAAEKILDQAARSNTLDWIAMYQAYAGDIEGARQSKKLVGQDVGDAQWSCYGRWLGWTGDFSGAQVALNNVKDIGKRDDDWYDISAFHTLATKNPDIARRAAENVQDPTKREWALQLISKELGAPAGPVDWSNEFVGVVELMSKWNIVDIEHALKDAGAKPSIEIPRHIASLAFGLSYFLLRIRVVEKRFLQQAQRAQSKKASP